MELHVAKPFDTLSATIIAIPQRFARVRVANKGVPANHSVEIFSKANRRKSPGPAD
jgi:hypothetical protein